MKDLAAPLVSFILEGREVGHYFHLGQVHVASTVLLPRELATYLVIILDAARILETLKV